MKKTLATILTAFMLIPTLVFSAACGRKTNVDETKTQLYIGNYTGGSGSAWLDSAVKRFNEKYATTSFEDGKVGVQINVDSNVSYAGNLLQTKISGDKNDIYFTNGLDYTYGANTGLFYDITEFVTAETGTDGKTIESKLSDEDKSALKFQDKYYGIPHNEFYYSGISYDAGVFSLKKLYFADEIDTADTTYPGTRKFIVNDKTKKSCGPDGVYGTYDDGLPSSYAELYKVMDKMTQNNVTPFVWTGKSVHYTNILTQALTQGYLGKDGAKALFTFDSNGKEVEIVTGFDANGKPIIEGKVITQENGYLMKSTAALYYASEFANKVFSNSKYYNTKCIAGTYTNINAMRDFVESGLDGNNYIAMIIDGSYWYNEAEADGIFERVKTRYPETYTQKQIKYMPIPQQYEGTVEEGKGNSPVMVDCYNCYCVVNAKIPESRIKLAKAFISFLYSDEELNNFTVETNGLMKGVSYDASTAAAKLSTDYAKSIMEIREAAIAGGSFIKAAPVNDIYKNNQTALSLSSTGSYFTSVVGSSQYLNAYSAAIKGVSAREYFEGLKIEKTVWDSSYNAKK